MTGNTWILVCDASRARLLDEQPKRKGVSLIESFVHAESRARVRDLVTDANGRKPVGPTLARRTGRQGAGHGRPGAAQEVDAKEVEATKFARKLAEVLEKGRNDHAYARLIIVAPPHFLGMLLGTVNSQVEKHIGKTINKDFAELELRQLTEHLQPYLQDALAAT